MSDSSLQHDGTDVLVHRAGPDSPHLEAAIALADTLADCVGFFPRRAFSQVAKDGRLLIATNSSGDYVGHLMYWQRRSPPFRVRIQQTCVHPRMRRAGVGRSLVRYLVDSAAGTYDIDLLCARDMAAADFWASMGFLPVGEKTGRGVRRRTLTHFLLESGCDTLFSEYDRQRARSTLRFVVDMNVFVDLRTPGCAESLALQDDWLTDLVSLWITPETWAEIDRDKNKARRHENRVHARSIPRLDAEADRVEAITRRLIEEFPPRAGCRQDVSDRRQLAFAIAGEADAFITRDEGILELAERVRHLFELRISRPVEALLELEALQGLRDYAPARLAGSELTRTPLRGTDVPELRDLRCHSPQEPWRQFAAKIRDAVARAVPEGRHELIRSDGTPVALWVATVDQKELTIRLLRVALGKRSQTIVSGLLQRVLLESGSNTWSRIRVVDQFLPPPVVEALDSFGFVHHGDAWLKLCHHGVIDTNRLLDWIGERDGLVRQLRQKAEVLLQRVPSVPAATLELERLFSPGLILSSDVPCYLVPIQPRWAKELFDSSLNEEALFTCSSALMLNCENAYYRSSRGPTIETPGRLLWYISSDQTVGQISQVRAHAPLISVQTGSAHSVYQRFRRLGIYEWRDLLETTKGDPEGDVMAMHFGVCRLLPDPIGLKALSELGLRAPQTVTKLTPYQARQLLAAGMMRGHTP